MLQAGDRISEGVVWLSPRESVVLPELVADGHALFLFFLYAWSST